MSTRRARIKAVTSLPPRRKNAETKENKNKNSIAESSQCNEINATNSGIDLISDQGSLEISPKAPPQEKQIKSPGSLGTILVTPTTPKTKSLNIFLSPQRRNSPKKTFASPIAPSPKAIKYTDNQKTLDTHKSGPVTPRINDFNELLISNTVINKINYSVESPKQKDKANETVFDGIVPLLPEGSALKPIDLLKSEIISENAEVLFDPIVPLPSPSKVRPKLKPVPRLGPYRRNSIQGSASESEDESRRSLLAGGSTTPAPMRQRYDSYTSHSTMISLPNRDVSRVRNDSVCSNVSQTTVQPSAASPVKEKQATKVRRPEVNRRINASKRRRDYGNRESLTMYDLIFYNPSTNPIVPDQDEVKAKEENEKDLAELNKKDGTLKEDSDDPVEEDTAPVPQIKLGPNGEIILDEKSLVIKQTESAVVRGTVREGAWSGGGGRYRRGPRSADWPPAETVRFYRALAALGTDFTLMAPLFPGRTRKELKLKFKKEEKINGAQVDKALTSATGWDMTRLKEEFEEEREKAVQHEVHEKEKILEQQRAERARIRDSRQFRVRRSKGSKALETTTLPGVIQSHSNSALMATADDILERSNNKQEQKKRKFNLPKTPAIRDPEFATLALTKNVSRIKTPGSDKCAIPRANMASPHTASESQNAIPQMPSNIETGSLVVLTVNDPTSPGKKMLQTYIANGPDKLTPVSLPATFLNSVVGYMNKNSMRGSSNVSSPNSIASQDSRNSIPNIAFTSPIKRQRSSNSYTITQL